MKQFINQTLKVLIYFITPEDSTRSGHSILSFGLPENLMNLGSLKTMFWFVNTLILLYLITLL
ncbi:MAG: hypothetical protein D3926_08165 [Desulfobacteraceae bacterium]|nr:MAG: hypothetical protein D3926_08165 [Desulfobacteraceae bacterium]